jgi:predicted esterase
MNCPFELTQELIEKLKTAGANVEFVTEATGHSSPSDNSLKLFHNWLEGIVSVKRDLEE